MKPTCFPHLLDGILTFQLNFLEKILEIDGCQLSVGEFEVQ
ncbi:hypothetical protein [Sulfurovum sp.]|nr:hypothetical protein [Sulfurovum sp.]